MIKQFVPQEFCLKCKGCCRFKDMDSVWAPCLLEEEIQGLLDKKIPPAAISSERRLLPVPQPGAGGYVCPFLNIADNKCKIYGFRPFECQLYPFLINLRNKRVLLTLDLNCPYIKENLKSEELKAYTEYLATFLNSPQKKKLLKDNPHVLQAYEEVLDLIELDIAE
jgi:Fe-S-cluster containining protein